MAGSLYDAHGRAVAYGVAAAAMLVLIVGARVFAGSMYHERPAVTAAPESVPAG
jgi:hypothetical protein